MKNAKCEAVQSGLKNLLSVLGAESKTNLMGL